MDPYCVQLMAFVNGAQLSFFAVPHLTISFVGFFSSAVSSGV